MTKTMIKMMMMLITTIMMIGWWWWWWWYSTWTLFFSWNIGPVHIISFSTELYYYLKYGIEPLIQQYKWLQQDLEVIIRFLVMSWAFRVWTSVAKSHEFLLETLTCRPESSMSRITIFSRVTHKLLVIFHVPSVHCVVPLSSPLSCLYQAYTAGALPQISTVLSVDLKQITLY